MTNVRANCRERLTVTDLEFVVMSVGSQFSVLSSQLPEDNTSHSALLALLAEPEALDAALESDKLLKALLESPGNIPVSPQLYFYVLTRHMLMKFDCSVADYVASTLAGFVDVEHRGTPACHALPPAGHLPYITDMLIALKSASSEREFMIRVQIGNHSLLMSGVFPQHIQHRSTHHASPPLSFYEEIGSQNYRRASDHRLAREQSLGDTYRTIADHFSEVRQNLNQMSDQLLCLESLGSASL
jgi:hypothetical protein